MNSIIKYIFLNSLRDKVYLAIFIALIAAFSLSIFLGQTSLVEQAQTTTAYIAGSSRFIIILGIILFVCLNVCRAFENKEVEFIISKPISREKFILSFLSGFLLTASIIIITLLAAIFLVLKIDKIGALFWFITLFLETLIVISFAFLSSLILKNSFVAILSSLAFYLLSRMMGIFVLAINLPQNFTQIQSQTMQIILKIISLAFPRLDLFTQSEWLIYGILDYSRIKIILIQAAIYIPLMIFMAFHDFKKKQF